MRTVTLRADVYQGLLAQLQEQELELREWRGMRRKPQQHVAEIVNAIRVATEMRGQCAGMLAVLLLSPGRVFDCDQLVDQAAPYCHGGQRKGAINANSVAKTRMADIRRTLEPFGHGEAVVTLRAAGYVIPPDKAAALKSWIISKSGQA